MRKIREVLRLRFQCGQTGEAISAAVGIAPSTVSGYLARAVRAGLTWELAEAMADHDVEARLFPPVDPSDRSPFVNGPRNPPKSAPHRRGQEVADTTPAG